MVAKTDATHNALALQFANREVEKVYLAIVSGEVPGVSGDIRARIARHPNHRKRMTVTEGSGHDAWTSYRVLERLQSATFLEAMLHTGRTHQIRVHFQHLGFPLIGDKIYGGRQNKRLVDLTGYHPPRPMLHAQKITFTHPKTGKKRTFEAPCPEDFKQALAALRVNH